MCAATMFNENMTPEMIADFKKWSRTLGGEDVMEGVEPDLKKYIQTGFCRDEFIKDMEYSWVNDIMFFDQMVEDPEYTQDTWEMAKTNEAHNLWNQTKLLKMRLNNCI